MQEETREIKMRDGSVLTLTLNQYAEKVMECLKKGVDSLDRGTYTYLQENMTELQKRWEAGWTPATVAAEVVWDGL